MNKGKKKGDKDAIQDSFQFLSKHPHFAALIKKHGPPDLERGVRSNYFQALCRSIIHQQLSGKAAETIYGRFVALFNSRKNTSKGSRAKFPTPEQVLKIPLSKLRSAGLSGQKASYLKDLAAKFYDGTIRQSSLAKMSSADIVEHLTQVKGIGVWSVHMFLIFTLNRPDILPTGDLGIRKGFQILFKLEELPDHKAMEKLAAGWREHATAASWYLWRAADEAKLT